MSAPASAPTRTRYAALIAASALLATLGLGVAPGQADESGSPSASPEASATSEDATTSVEANNPDWEPPETVDTYVGQSVQVRKNADGFQNSDLANFRWTVTQVNAESLNGLDTSVPLPMDDAPGLRSLTGRGNMPTVVDGGVLYDFDDVNGVQTKRTLNLWPQDRTLAVDVTAEFTLDGEKVQAQDIVGKGGLVTATYTIINQSVETQDVTFQNVKGDDDTEEVETSQAFVGISKQFIPQSWAQFDPGNGIFGADGRGNYQTQWISLAFLPFAEEGKASFGWTAVIPEGEGFIPKMVIEVSPLYVPTHVSEDEAQGAAAQNGVPKPNVDPAISTVQSGVEDLVAGVSSLADTIGAATGATKEGISIAVSQIKAAVAELCAPELLDCAAPEPEDPLELSEVIATLDQTIAAIDAYVAGAVGEDDPFFLVDYLNRIEADVTETKTQAEAELVDAQNALAEAQGAIQEAQSSITEAQAAIGEAQTAKAEAQKALDENQKLYDQVGCGQASEGQVTYCPGLEAAITANKAAIAANEAAIKKNELTITANEATIKRNEAAVTANQAAIKKNELVIQAADRALASVNEAQAYVDANIGNLSTEALKDLSAKLTKVNNTLKGIQAQIELLQPPLADLQAGLDSIGAAIDAGGAILGDVGSSLDQISSGRAQVSAGLGSISDSAQAYIADVVALAQATAAEGKETAAEVEAQANTVKAEMAGLKGRMAESPLPYAGGFNTAYAPAGDPAAVQEASIALLPNNKPVDETDGIVHTAELFGAYQFMLDPADSNKPNTPWRIGLALIFVVGAGLIGMRVAPR
jgi:predicted  nucleic acid-binding Zn-ribbon protein